MSYAVERLNGHWWSEGYRFATREEAEAYGNTMPTMDPRRIVKSDERANYQFKDGRLVPGAAKHIPTTWEDYMKGGFYA